MLETDSPRIQPLFIEGLGFSNEEARRLMHALDGTLWPPELVRAMQPEDWSNHMFVSLQYGGLAPKLCNQLVTKLRALSEPQRMAILFYTEGYCDACRQYTADAA